jgi:hypothetical protein
MRMIGRKRINLSQKLKKAAITTGSSKKLYKRRTKMSKIRDMSK